MLLITRLTFMAIVLVLLSTTTSIAANQKPSPKGCPTLTAGNRASQEMSQAAEDIMDKFIIKPDSGKLKDCISGIMSIGTKLDIGLPSLGDLLGKACDRLKSEVRGQISQLNQSYKVDAFNGAASIGGSAGTNSGKGVDVDVNVKDRSDEIFNSIWDSIQ